MKTRTFHQLIIIMIFTTSIFLGGCGAPETETLLPTQTEILLPTQAVVIIPKTETTAVIQPTREPVFQLPTNLVNITKDNWNQLEPILEINEEGIHYLELSPNNQYLLMRVDGGVGTELGIKIYDISSGKEVLALDTVSPVYFDPFKPAMVILEGSDVIRHNLITKDTTIIFSGEYQAIALSPDLQSLIVRIPNEGQKDSFKIINIGSGEETEPIYTEAPLNYRNIKFNSQSKVVSFTYGILTSTGGTTVSTFWDVSTGHHLHTLYGLRKISYIPYLQIFLASHDNEGHISIIRSDTFNQVRYLGAGGEGSIYNYNSLGFTSWSSFVYAVINGNVQTWDYSTGESLGFIHFPNLTKIILFSLDSKLLVRTSDYAPGAVTIWGIIPR